MGKLSGKIVVRRVAICEQVIQKLKKFENKVMNERTFQIEIIKKEGKHDLHRMSSLITDPQQQPSNIILEQLTSDLQVRIEGSEKIVSVTTGKCFTKYRISVMVSISKAKESVHRVYGSNCSCRHGVLFDLISLLMCCMESYLSNKPKQCILKTFK